MHIYFRDDENAVEEIKSLPGVSRYGVKRLVDALQPVVDTGLKSVLLFGVPSSLPKVHEFEMIIIINHVPGSLHHIMY